MLPHTLTRARAKNALKAMLEEAGLTLDALDLEKAWDIFIEFCKIPIESETDGVIVQWVPIPEILEDDPFPEVDRNIGFEFQVLRQFDDGRHMGYEQLRLTWRYRLDDYLNTLDVGRSDWCFAEKGCRHEDLLKAQKQSALFQYLKERTPYETVIYQQSV